MRSEVTAALNVAFQRLMDTITIYHSPRRKAKPASRQPQEHQTSSISSASASRSAVSDKVNTAAIEAQQASQDTRFHEELSAPAKGDKSSPPPSLPQQQPQRPTRRPHVTLGGIRGPIRLPKAGRVHSRRVYLIQVSERALRQIAADSAIPLHDQMGEVAISQEQEGAVEVIFELE
ncbi:hypothetical protein BGW41_005759 [Actinomortierella wolfii]|nr:hypothetical protein BGW41_005759 [Actinomortierella wolfii]